MSHTFLKKEEPLYSTRDDVGNVLFALVFHYSLKKEDRKSITENILNSPTILVCEHGSPEQENLDFICYFEFSWSEFLYFSSFTKYFSHSLPYSTPISYIYIHWWYIQNITSMIYANIFRIIRSNRKKIFTCYGHMIFCTVHVFWSHDHMCKKSDHRKYLFTISWMHTHYTEVQIWLICSRNKNSLFFDFWN